ncbi:hypothetical protein DMUE_5732 [Dictyocoela muelleri]|nr:hypothetical protein DMUE_5732 [Dictyocoela muelleri]
MVEKSNSIIYISITKRNSCTLSFLNLIRINKKKKVFSDKWGGYRKLKLLGYKYKTVNHSKNIIDLGTGYTLTLMRNGRGLRRSMSVNHRRMKYLRSYLLRYMIWRNISGNYISELLKLILNYYI